MATERVYGIDLGTTYSCIAYIDDAGRPVVIPNAEGDNTTPSVVYFETPDSIIVGKEAKNLSKLYPEQVAAFVKQEMGNADFSFPVHGKSYRAEQVSALVLKKLVQDAAQMPEVGEVRDVVITVPAYFGAAEREATRQAGIIAGLNVRDIIPEPTAAAICYGAQQAANQTVLVYDLGGGTFDVTIIRIETGRVRVLQTNGNHRLGGKDWDARLTQFFAGAFQEQHPDAGDPMDDLLSLQEFSLEAERSKQALSAKERDARALSHGGKRARIEITRTQFEEMTGDLVEQTLTLTRNVLDDARQQGHQYTIDKVLLVGGSSKMPYVKRRLQELTGVEPEIFEPDQSVAKGAALYAMNVQISDAVEDYLPKGVTADTATAADLATAQNGAARDLGLSVAVVRAQPTILNVCAKSYGLVLVNMNDETSHYVHFIIHANSTLPIEHTDTSYTIRQNQSGVNIQVMEQAGETASPDVAHNKEIASGQITGITPNLPRGSPIENTFRLETDGTLHVKAREPSSGRELKLEVKVAGIMSKAEVTAAQNMMSRVRVV